jgi:hypothetical protein
MSHDPSTPDLSELDASAQDTSAQAPKILTPAAQRALAEAEARRRSYDQQATTAAPLREINGREGPEAVRYGDWEVKGIATDF